MAAKKETPRKLIAENRRARFEYHLENDIEAGLQLTGTEVKSLRQARRILLKAMHRLRTVVFS